MVWFRTFTSAAALVALMLSGRGAVAEMGRCVPAVDFDLMCGNGDGAARAIVKTISPSQRLAFAWRFANKPPTNPPNDPDPNLENLIVRIEDGAVLAKSHGSYWDLGTKIAKAYLMTAWSPDSRLLVKVEQRAAFSSAELFAFVENDAAIGPFDLVKTIEPAVLAEMSAREDGTSGLVFVAHPPMTISNQGLLHAVVRTTQGEYGPDGPTYDVALQIMRAANSINAKVISVTPHAGASITITVH
jgi:hypothetical protein